MQASQRQLLCLKAILESFAQSTGLRVNYAKSRLVPLNLYVEKAEHMVGVFGCKKQEMPFTYLGLPMGTTRPRVEHYGPILNRMERQLTSISSFHARHLQLVNSVLTTSPTYTMCSLTVPITVHEYFTEPEGTVCGEIQTAMPRVNLLAWKKCTRPKRKGGLGIGYNQPHKSE
jgi:hypothetical protein